MNLLCYLGKTHTAWCNWQGHSNGHLRIKGKHTDGSVDFVFSISWYKFYFYVTRNRKGYSVIFRKLRIINRDIYFTRKWKRELYLMRNRLAQAQQKIAGMEGVLELHKTKMYELLVTFNQHKYVEYDEPIRLEHHYTDYTYAKDSPIAGMHDKEYLTICRSKN